MDPSDPISLETNHFEIGPNWAKTAIGRAKTARSPNLFTRNFGVCHLLYPGIILEYRARNFVFWKGLVIPQIKTMLGPIVTFPLQSITSQGTNGLKDMYKILLITEYKRTGDISPHFTSLAHPHPQRAFGTNPAQQVGSRAKGPGAPVCQNLYIKGGALAHPSITILVASSGNEVGI